MSSFLGTIFFCVVIRVKLVLVVASLIIASHHAIITFLHIDVVFLFIVVVVLLALLLFFALLLLLRFALLMQHAFNTCFFIYLSCLLSNYCSYVLPSYYSNLELFFL